ncbi:PKD domain-containing protein [Pontiellaceae bacterium B12227]|nr:PKD domain-containing protein [Pontiellaceae bacterium B12227]
MMESRKKPFVVGSILVGVIVGALVLRQKSEYTKPDSPATADEPVVLKTSTDWAKEIAAINLDEGVRQARARGEMMRELIRTHPEQAIRESLSLSDWSRLPPEIQAHVEQPFSAVANVEVMIACGDGSSQTSISTEFSDIGNVETFVYGRRKEIGSKSGIPVQGIRIGNVGVLRENTFQPLEGSDELAALELYPVATEDPGGDSAVALAGGRLFYFKSRADLNEANERLADLDELPGADSGAKVLFQDLEAAMMDGKIDFQALEEQVIALATAWTSAPRDMYVVMVDFSDNQGQPADPVAFSNSLNTTVSQQIGEMSYGKTHIAATVNPKTYRMPLPTSSYTNNSALLYTDGRDLAIADGADLSSYETICVLFKEIDSIWWAGLASIDGVRMRLNGNTNPDVVIHELGHNYRAWHASSWTNTVSSNPVEQEPAGGKLEYGDFTDIMGGGDSPEGHFNVWHKKHLGWFDADNWQAVTNSGSYRIYRSDDDQTTGLLRGLEVEKGSSDHYWVGLRQEYTSYETFSRGAYLLWKKSGDSRSYLLDTSPLSAEGGYDGGLALGQTYSDASAGVHITPVARGGKTPNEWMDITVNLGSFPGNSAPTASLSGPATLGVQESALFSVMASDVDGDELAYYWDIGDGFVKPNSPSIAAAWLTGGTATVSCVVSDMKGGTNWVSQTVSIANPTENWMQRTSGTSLDLMDVAVGNGRLVVVCEDETTLYSDDGINWTSHQSYDIYANNIFLGAVVYDGLQFIAVGMDHDYDAPVGWEQVIFTSSDGTYWTQRYGSDHGSSSNIRLLDVAYGDGVYIAVGENGSIVRSTDAINWNPVVSGTTTNLTGVSYGDGSFVAVGAHFGGGPANVLTSSDGLLWTNRSSGVDLDNWQGLWDIEYLNDRFLAGGWYAKIMHSLDQGQTFTTSMTGNGLIIPAFAYGDGTYFAAGHEKVYSGSWMTFDINLISLDGESWTALTTASQDDRNAAVFFNGTFITVGDNGAIWQSGTMGSGDGGFAVWQLENEAALGLNRDPMDDADFDGVYNLQEYAMGSSASDAGEVPAEVVSDLTGSYFQVSYARDGIKSDIDYAVERSENLSSNDWNSASTVTLEDSASNLTVRSAIPMAGQTNEFMRLNLELK